MCRISKSAQAGCVYETRTDDAKYDVHAQTGVGYRMFDCAEFYENEHIIGPALQSSGVGREDLSVAVANEGGCGVYSGENMRVKAV